MSRLLAVVAGTALCLGLLTVAAPADAAPKKSTSCAKVHLDHSGGIAKPGVTRNRLSTGTSVALNGRVKHSFELYRANERRLDRDHDGVACEV